jgi:hypothetical protein
LGSHRRQITVCDRCPVGRELLATTTERFGIGESWWEIDLCQTHADALERDVQAWARLGRTSSAPQTGSYFDDASKERAKRAAELRARQTVTTAPRFVEPVVEPVSPLRAAELPVTADRWRITKHAEERMVERGFTRHDVLMAAERPELVQPAPTRPGEDNHCREHKRGRCMVIVDPDTNDIRTVKIAARGTYADEPSTQIRRSS